VRNKQAGGPLGTLAPVREINGPLIPVPAAVNGNSAAGVRTGEVIDIVDRLAGQELTPAVADEQTEFTFIQLLGPIVGVAIIKAVQISLHVPSRAIRLRLPGGTDQGPLPGNASGETEVGCGWPRVGPRPRRWWSPQTVAPQPT
jgi:hypothetical protein